MLKSQRNTFIEQTVAYNREKDRKIVEKLDQAFIAYKKGIENRSDRRAEQKEALEQAMEDFQYFAAEFYLNESRYKEPEIQVFHSYNTERQTIEKDAIVIKLNGVCYRAKLSHALTAMDMQVETVGPVLSRPENWLVSVHAQPSIAGEFSPRVKDYTLYYTFDEGSVDKREPQLLGCDADKRGFKLRFNIEGVTYQLHKTGGGAVST